jgi:hypothetical protein
MILDVSSEIPKMLMQTNRFRKLNGNFGGKGGSPVQHQKRNSKHVKSSKNDIKKSPSNAVFKYSLNGFINSNRFVKNYRTKERGSTGNKKHVDLVNKLQPGKKKDSKRSKLIFNYRIQRTKSKNTKQTFR